MESLENTTSKVAGGKGKGPGATLTSPIRSARPESATSALPHFIEEIERKAIEQALTDNRYNKTRAAAQLGITFRALRYKLKKLGID